jgi:hypothetical protein
MQDKVVVPAWETLLPGDKVKITGEGGIFTFISATRSAVTNEVLHLTFFGGKPKYQKTRMFLPDRVVLPTEKELQKQRKTLDKGQKENA